jgi:hypothetical protein
LAVNNALWPMIWPTPYAMTTTLRLGGPDPTRVTLPVVPFEARPRPNFLPPAEDPQYPGYRTLKEETASGYGEIARVERDVARKATKVTALNSGGTEFPWGRQRFDEAIVHETQDEHPEATSVRGSYRSTVELKDRTLAWECDIHFRSDRTNFYYTGTRRLLQDGRLLREKTWEDTIPRDHQ